MKRINLLQAETKKAAAMKLPTIGILKSPFSRLVVIAIVGFISLNVWHATSLLRHEIAITAGKKAVAELEARLAYSQKMHQDIIEEKQEIDEKKKRVEAKARVLQQTQTERKDRAEILVELAKIVPEDLWLTKVAFKKGEATIGGATSSNEIVSRFMAELDKSDYFEGTNFNYTQKAKGQDKQVINFELTTRLTRGAREEAEEAGE